MVPLLEAKGHRVVAPDSPGLGDDRTPWVADTFKQWVDAAATAVEAQGEPVVLVGHSRGTTIISAVGEQIPDRIVRLVYISGFALANGEALADVGAASPEVLAAVVANGDGTQVSIDPEQAADIFYHLAPNGVAARAVARLRAEPMQPLGVPLTLSRERYGRLKRDYIETTEDHALPLALQREAQKRWPFDNVVALPSDHSPFFSMPERLAETLDGLTTR